MAVFACCSRLSAPLSVRKRATALSSFVALGWAALRASGAS